MGRSLLAPVPDDGAGALDDLPGLALLVDLAETSPLAQLHVRVHLDQWDPVLLRNRTVPHSVHLKKTPGKER